ncbi:MAG TPA: DUF1302 domain-containing protein [Rhodocyclaceae bacterium]|nr:DUF1302 domain-containing protein [Rhodocyclaceae bacterium]
MTRKIGMAAVRRPAFALRRLGAAVALALAAPATVLAFEFQSADGALTGSFDTTLSIGALWRMESREASLIGITSGGTSRDPNADDGNLAYKRGELVSAPVKATHDLELAYRNFGAFLRASYFYDEAIMSKGALGSRARREIGRDAEILDAFVRGTFEVGGRNLNVRVGKQVVNWGESTFIFNGINVLNPVNVSRLRMPGSELREGLIPTPMIWASQELSDNVSVEAVWMAQWEKTRIDPVGTFFSTNDFVGRGGERAFTGFGRRNDANGALGVFPLHPTAALWAPRSKDRKPGDGGEYGLALRAFLPQLNFTEIGLFHVNYHSRTPFVSGFRGGITAAGTISSNLGAMQAGALTAAGIPAVANGIPGCTALDIPTFGALHTAANIGALAGVLGGNVAAATALSAVNATNAACASAALRGGAGTYFVDYPKDIKLYGVSFNTAGPAGIALQGEYSYRRNQPLQLPSAELLGAALGIGNQLTSTNPLEAAAVPYGAEITGYRRVKMHQMQVTATNIFGPTLGAEQLVVVGEVGYTRLQLPSGQKFAAPGCHLPQPGSATAASFGSTDSGCFATKNSWGYRLLGRLDYPNAIGAATLSPRLAFSHDVNGRSPTFNEGAKAVTLGLGFNYRQSWQADIAYTAFFGGKKIRGTDPVTSPAAGFPAGQPASYASHTNPLVDRDFLAVSVSYSF